jgi:uncharacterized protein
MEQITPAFHPVERNTDGVYNTVSGKLIDLRNPSYEAIEIYDIANALAHICRFGGHSRNFYSVAQHSLLVCALAPEELKKEALMHDAAEAYTGDVIKPLKNQLGSKFHTIESEFNTLIGLKFELHPLKLQAIKEYDIQALHLEHKALQLGDPTELLAAMKGTGMRRLSPCTYCSPGISMHHFLNQFSILFPNHPITKPAWI